jgi:hypothetical protein
LSAHFLFEILGKLEETALCALFNLKNQAIIISYLALCWGFNTQIWGTTG